MKMPNSFRARLTRSLGVVGILGVALVVGLVTAPGRRSSSEARDAFPGLAPSEVSTVDLDNGLRLERDATGWTVATEAATVPARTGRVDSFVDALTGTRIERTVVDDPGDSAAQFGLGQDESRITAYGSNGNEVAAIAIGSADGSSAGYFARLGSASSISVVDGALAPYLARDLTYWSDRRLFAEEPSATEIVSILGRAGDQPIDFARERAASGDRWVDRSRPGEALDSNEIDSYLRQLLALEATAVEPAESGVSPDDTDDTDATMQLRVADQAGREYSLTVQREGETVIVVRGEGMWRGYRYRIDEDAVERIERIADVTPQS